MTLTPISRVRRFNRAVTSTLGVLDSSFLGRGRPLGLARVIHAIGHEGREVGDIRAHLKMDKALLSRMLKTLVNDGLVQLHPDAHDARKRTACLTPDGERELDAYNSLSDDHARALLARHPQTEALLKAMDLVATAFGQDAIEIIQVDPQAPDAVHCLTQYYGELARRLDTGFDVSLSCDPDAADMQPPRGAFFLASSDGLPLGCAGLKGNGGTIAEVKRLWVAPAARGLGLAHRLMGAIEAAAPTLGIGTLRLDTNSSLSEAVAFYRNTGWAEIDRFNQDPYPDVFFEKPV